MRRLPPAPRCSSIAYQCNEPRPAEDVWGTRREREEIFEGMTSGRTVNFNRSEVNIPWRWSRLEKQSRILTLSRLARPVWKKNHNPGFWDTLGLKHSFSGFLKPRSMDFWVSKSYRNYMQNSVCVCACVRASTQGISMEREAIVHQTHKKENGNNSCTKVLCAKGINELRGLWKE